MEQVRVLTRSASALPGPRKTHRLLQLGRPDARVDGGGRTITSALGEAKVRSPSSSVHIAPSPRDASASPLQARGAAARSCIDPQPLASFSDLPAIMMAARAGRRQVCKGGPAPVHGAQCQARRAQATRSRARKGAPSASFGQRPGGSVPSTSPAAPGRPVADQRT